VVRKLGRGEEDKRRRGEEEKRRREEAGWPGFP
jgi:hypothetical protein